LPPFLEVFKAAKQPPVVTKNVTFVSATGSVTGALSRPATSERLPAVLVIHDEDGLTAWMKLNAGELASIGYVVLAVNLKKRSQQVKGAMSNERTLADLSAAVRWLRRRFDVFPDRIGVVGWGWGGEQSLALAASLRLPACVICDSRASVESSVVAGLRHTALLGVFAGNSQNVQRAIPAFRQSLENVGVLHKIHVFEGVQTGFMCPTNRRAYAKDAAEQAWYEIYEFLGKHVEDAGSNIPAEAQTPKPIATIADIMRAVNAPTGVRSALIQSLEKEPNTQQEWDLVRARAAVIAEAGNLLQTLSPRKGTQSRWTQHVQSYREAANAIVAAADQRDHAAAQRGLQQLAMTCSACHLQHR
jgi:carboxymethylenebutenolidase